jgi:hypothetical protein
VAKPHSHRWLILFVTAAFLFGAVSTTLSLLAHSRRANRLLTARLAQTFGRDVEVSYYDWHWLPSPGIVAHYVTIYEDPRFGQEYFLRAQSVAASPRWRALLSGRLELGALELVEPSLNLVRNADGRWNVESWLPQAPSSKPTLFGPHAPGPGAQLTRIEITRGRINFSRGVDRHPFALAELEGAIEQESPGRWRIELEARPLRATVHLQDTGIVRVTGYIAGTSARLHPAELDVTWNDASIADVLRLAMGRDPGVRGSFQMELTARTAPVAEGAPLSAPMWEFSLGASVAGPHRWDVSARQSDPQLSVRAEASWQAGASQVVLSKLLLEGPHSSVMGSGNVDWSHEILPELRFESSGVAFADLLDWYRAFQPRVEDVLTADGFLRLSAELRGWPFHIVEASLTSPWTEVKLHGSTFLVVTGIEGTANGFSGRLNSGVWFGPPSGSSIDLAQMTELAKAELPHEWLNGSATFSRREMKSRETAKAQGWRYQFFVSASLDHVERMLQAAKAFGQSLSNNWDAEGGLDATLDWQWASGEHFPKPTGQVTLRDVALRLPLLNQPVEIADTKIELSAIERRITVKKASALGANWQGTIIRRDEQKALAKVTAFTGWNFDLTADHLDSTDLDQWLGPRARPGWMTRLFSSQDTSSKDTFSGSSSAQAAVSGPLSTLHARGNLRVGLFRMAPLVVEKLSADLEMQGRTINLSKFDAQLCGGSISGGLLLNLEGDPSYWLHVSAASMNAGDLGDLSPALRGNLAGNLSGEARISMHGIGRGNLLASMKGAGTLSAKGATIQGFSLSDEAPSADSTTTGALFSLVNAEFSVSSQRITFERIALLDSVEPYEGHGTADFGRGIQFELWPRPIGGSVERIAGAPPIRRYRVTGLLEAPLVAVENVSPGTPQSVPQPTPPPARH